MGFKAWENTCHHKTVNTASDVNGNGKPSYSPEDV
jgi:hypothetical protein